MKNNPSLEPLQHSILSTIALYMCAFAFNAFSQTPAGWTVFTHQNGLAGSGVYAIASNGGSTWLGTYGGIALQYNGNSFTQYDIRATADPAYGGYAACVDAQNNFWYGTSFGAKRYNGSTWTTYDTLNGLPNNEVRAIVKDTVNNIWIATLNGIARFSGTTWNTFTTAHGLIDNCVFSLVVDKNGTLWAGSITGISKFNGTNWESFGSSQGYTGGWTLSLAVDANNTLWAGTYNKGLWSFNGTTWQHITSTKTDGSTNLHGISALACDRLGSLWLGASLTTRTVDNLGNASYRESAGLYKFNSNVWTTFDSSKGLAGNYVRALYIDQTNIMWVGTEDGLTRCADLATPTVAIALITKGRIKILYNRKMQGFSIHVPASEGTITQAQVVMANGTIIASLKPQANSRNLFWNGTSASSAHAAAGAYFLRLLTVARTSYFRMIKTR